MAYEILTESYGRRLPKITATADSTDDLASLGTNYAEGSTCVIGDTTYKLDKVQGWVDPSSGGGGLPDPKTTDGTYVLTQTVEDGEATNSWEAGGGGGDVFVINANYDYINNTFTYDTNASDAITAAVAGKSLVAVISLGESGAAPLVCPASMVQSYASGGGDNGLIANFMLMVLGNCRLVQFEAVANTWQTASVYTVSISAVGAT